MPNNYVLLETIALTQSAASVTFDNLPTSGYTDLKVVVSSRTDQTGSVGQDVYVRFNGDSGANYSFRRLYGTGVSSASDAVSSSATGGRIGRTTSVDATANTFASTEFYIPNYRSSVAKSISGEGVDETNATAAIAQMTATIWTGTAAITSMQLFPFSSGTNFVAGSTFSLYGVAALGTTPVLAPKATGGNIVANDGTYWYHAFTSSGNFVPQVGLTADVLVIAGGGGGGGHFGGGGGAGGFKVSTAQTITSNQTITIGAGGAGGVYSSSSRGVNGVSSSCGSLSTTGGGGGATRDVSITPGNGGSGGGGTEGATGGTAVSGEGFAGGNGNNNSPQYGGGGGGGSGAVGQNGSSSAAGNGGAGLNTYSTWASATSTGVSGYYAGGGGAGAQSTSGTGGSGGGGNGGTTPTAGTANTGGGGGGRTTNTGTGGAGGSGIILIRYPIA